MTKTTAKAEAAKTEAAANTYFSSIQNALEGVSSKIEVPASAREFVQRTAASAKDRAETVHTGANKATETVEKFATSLVGGYANFTRGLLDATLANVQHALTTVEKVAAAKSVNEAIQLQADYVRESANANIERVKNAAETAKTALVDGAKSAQAELSKLYSADKKAA